VAFGCDWCGTKQSKKTTSPGAIGYVDYADAKASGLSYASIKNKDGKYNFDDLLQAKDAKPAAKGAQKHQTRTEKHAAKAAALEAAKKAAKKSAKT